MTDLITFKMSPRAGMLVQKQLRPLLEPSVGPSVDDRMYARVVYDEIESALNSWAQEIVAALPDDPDD